MADTDPATTLHALAKWCRSFNLLDLKYGEDRAVWLALAEHVEGVAQRHEPVKVDLTDGEQCEWCSGWGAEEYALEPYPCPDVTELLAVAAAAGITP